MALASHAAAHLPVPGTPPAARSPGQRGSWDPGWPPASTQSPSPTGKRSRIGTPIPGVAISPEELHRTITALIELANDHSTRIDDMERDAKLVADGVGTLGRYCQSEIADVRGHLAASVADLGKAMQTIDATLRATMDAASERFAECQRDEKELMLRTEAALTQLGAKVQELERGVTEMSTKVAERFKEIQHEMQKKQPTEGTGDAHRDAWVGGVGAGYGPS